MTKKVIRLISVIIAIIMVACTVGCGGDSDNKKDNPSSKPSQNANDKVPGMLPGVDPEDYRGTTVKYASWKDPWQNEDGDVIDKFMKETGITVEWVQVPQNGYVNTIATHIASGTQPDVFFESETFPGSLTVMQPLDASMIDISDPFWNQSVIKASTLDGHAYLVDAVANIWSEVDVCVYNKKIFEDNGIKSPAEYYAEGEWTFENFRKAAIEVSKLGKEYTGAGIEVQAALGAAGSSFFTYKDSKMSLTADQHLYDVMNFLTKMREDGYLKVDRWGQGFDSGKQGMHFVHCFGLKRTGFYSNISPEYIGVTYLPVWEKGDEQQVTGIYRGWGLVDGAKNPVAAGLFLRSYLDVNNYNLDKTFHNQEAANFFFQVTGALSEDMIYYHGENIIKSTGLGQMYHEYIQLYSSSNIKSVLDEQRNVMEQMCEKANEIIEKERKQIKQYEDEGKINKLS